MAVTNYIWDVRSDSYLQETDASDITAATYTNDPAGRLISQYHSMGTSYYHYDGLGSASALTDDNETVTDTYMYSAFGDVVASTGTTENPFQWVGEVGYYFDEALDSFYIRARIYGPTIARWSSLDPLSADDALSMYLYVGNNALNAIDPSGLIDVTIGKKPQFRSRNIDFSAPCISPAKVKWGEVKTAFKFERPKKKGDPSEKERIANSLGIDTNNVGFIQKVTIDIEDSIGACRNLNCNTTTTCKCPQVTAKYHAEFYESFSREYSDGHPAKGVPILLDLVNNNAKKYCGGQIKLNFCCPWQHTQKVKKELSAGLVGGAYVEIVKQSATITCNGKTTQVADSDIPKADTIPPHPVPQTKVVFPGPKGVVTTKTSNKQLQLSHTLCGRVKGTLSWTNYQ